MKIAITSGIFDCLDVTHFHLIKEMRKAVLPDGHLYVFLYDDYPSFCMNNKFPIQEYLLRYKNLSYLVPTIERVYKFPHNVQLQSFIKKVQSDPSVDRIIYFDFKNTKETPGSIAVKELKVPVKLIKLPKKYEKA